MLGYCGINCDNCPAYQGTVTGDLTLLDKAAGSFAGGAYEAKDWVCLGCTPAQQPILAKSCAGCRVRACAVSKTVFNCAACADYEGCAQLHEFMEEEGPGVVQTMARLRERYLDGQRRAGSER